MVFDCGCSFLEPSYIIFVAQAGCKFVKSRYISSIYVTHWQIDSQLFLHIFI